MCGIAGLLGDVGRSGSLGELVSRMTSTLSHRGPDGAGHWVDSRARVALGHRRLAIIDLSATGKQPMISASGRFVITFNGEIYNFEEIRDELLKLGHQFKGRADTEVLLASIEQWGVEATLKRLTGMFAFALWDNSTDTLTLVRDRLGKKPLYYGTVGKSFAFASELKALTALPEFSREINVGALQLYLRHNYVPAPTSIYQSIAKLEPGAMLQVVMSERGYKIGEPVQYWSPQDVFSQAAGAPFCGSLPEAVEEFDALLTDAVRLRMISDVPLGAFLSGGIDSSLIVALMQKQSSRPVRTFTVGFQEPTYNEADHARAVAKHLNTDHTELVLRPEDALSVIPELPTIYDEPFADSSQIPTILVCREARAFVTVAVSGDGGDESFGGYSRYVWWRNLWGTSRRVPAILRPAVQRLMRAASVEQWDAAARIISTLLPKRYRISNFGDRIHKVAELVGCNDPLHLYRRLVSLYQDPASLTGGGVEPSTVLSQSAQGRSTDEFMVDMMMLDLATYLPDDILVKVDRASMATSLEVRAPLLDHRVVEAAARLPLDFKIRGGKGKIVLRHILDRYVPRDLVDKPKTGFGVPIDSWLCGSLREWAEDLLSEQALNEHGLLDVHAIRKQWLEHVSGARRWHYHLWTILMFQAWWRTQTAPTAACVSEQFASVR